MTGSGGNGINDRTLSRASTSVINPSTVWL
jgi:hypothetical protein